MFCPECGYNLAGIPENRCPECGFGYEHAAIRSIAYAQADRRSAGYRRLVTLGSLVVICVLASTLGGFGRTRSGFPVLRTLCLALPFFVATLYLIPQILGWFDSPAKVLLCIFSTPPLALAAVVYPRAFLVLATGLLALAAVTVLRLPSGFHSADCSLPTTHQQRLRRWHVAAWISMSIAIGSVLLGWFS